MRVVIFCDMEGISCIETWEQVSAGKPFYEESRKLYTDEMNAAVRGARAAGASDISVVDCHGAGGAYSFKSFLPDRLESGAQYVFGYPWARYIQPFEQGCDAILFVGAHAMAGTPDGVLCHTVSSEAWYNAWINDTLVGESGILAAVAGCWDVPAIFREIQAAGRVPDGEMARVFNLGLGMVVVVPAQDATAAVEVLAAAGQPEAAVVGEVVEGPGPVVFED